MTVPSTSEVPAFFVSADWSKHLAKRSVWVAEVAARKVLPAAPQWWTLPRLMALAQRYCDRGSVLVGVDAALGVSTGYWRLINGARRPLRFGSFLDWLRVHDPRGSFFQTTTEPQLWSVDRPWFSVQPRPGGRTAFTEGVDDGFLRRIDVATAAKPLFAVGGIPGTVGSATRSLWQELVPFLGTGGDVAIWPFEGELSVLLTRHGIVLAETYPRLAYGAALADTLPTGPLSLAKTRQAARELACDRLQRATWVRSNGVDLGDNTRVIENEDDFDAYMTAAAVLRCAIAAVPLSNPDWVDSQVEGSMLLAGAVDPARPRRALRHACRTR